MGKYIGDKLKVWNFDAHSLRGRNFFKGVQDYREKILPIHKGRIRARKDFHCVLCGGRKGELFLSWKEGYELFSCPVCDAVSANVAADSRHVDDVYNNEIYYQKFKDEILKHYEYRKNTQGEERFKYVVSRLKLNPKKAKVLDVGCGAGYFVSVLKEKGVEAKGLEVNPAQVRYCKEQGLNVEGNDLSEEKDGFYDAITMFDVLEHLSDPVATFKTVMKKLKPGGFLVAYTPNIHSLAYELMGSDQNTLLPFEHFCFYSKPAFNFLAKKSGMRIFSVEVMGLDVMDYLLMREFKDGVDYTEKLRDFMNWAQACVDKLELGNHFRLTMQKARRTARGKKK